MTAENQRGALYRVDRAGPAQPRHLRRAVLRPGVRVRGHAALAHAARASHAVGALQTVLLLMAVWWVWVYTSWVTNWLDPEQHAGARAAVRADARRAGAVGVDPEAFEERGAVRSPAPMRACRSARGLFMLWALPAPRRRQLSQLPAHHGLALRCRRRSGSPAAGRRRRRGSRCGPSRSAIEYVAPAVRFLDAGARPLDHRRLGRRGRATWPSAAGCSSSSRSASRSW